MASYRDIYIENQIEALRDNPEIVALWEGGSAATGSTDQYSDIDLLALCAGETDEAFDLIESAMCLSRGIETAHLPFLFPCMLM